MFDFKLHKKLENNDDYLDPTKQKSKCKIWARKLFFSVREVLCCGIFLQTRIEKFVEASSEEYLKFIKVTQWKSDAKEWIYFSHLNPFLLLVCFFGGY
mmetsp:Transcript_33257/g.24436  ORF Transcript_33257/g.24436 Transcript_33257/m.24436 type:complete len:98 (-) Transcript_33257:319-612(-)